MSHGVTVSEATGLLALPAELTLEHGEVLRGGQLAYELVGPPGAPLVIVQGGISSGRCAGGGERPGWWEPIVGPGRAVDTRRYRVLATDYLGGGGASSGPASSAQRPFPAVTSADQARAIELLLEALGETEPVTFVGASYGGMVGLSLAALAPRRLRHVVAIGAADRSLPLATAWRCVQRGVIALGQECGEPLRAVALARGLAMATYRSAAELCERFAAPPVRRGGRPRFAVEDYLLARGRAFAAHHGAGAYLVLSQAIDLHRIDPAAVTVPVTLVAVDSDQLVPPAQLRELALRLAGPARVVELTSRYGHDAFLKEAGALAPILRGALPPTAVEVLPCPA